MDKRYLSSLLCGFGAAVLSTIPGMNSIACCLLVPIASGLSLLLYKKSQPDLIKIKTGTGVILGLLTGIFAALFASGFEIIITAITKSTDLISAIPQTENLIKDMNLGPAAEESIKLLKKMASEIQTSGFSFLYSIIITLSNLISYSIFGILGGVLGTAIINKRSSG